MNKLPKEQVWQFGRVRAYSNRNGGGILLTAQNCTTSRTQGVRWRCLLDGGNYCRGKALWVAGEADGGGYNVRDAALAEAVRGVCRREMAGRGSDFINWANTREWAERASAVGWTLYLYDEAGVVLIPSASVAEAIKAEVDAEAGK